MKNFTLYKIKDGEPLSISADPFPVTDDENIQLLLEDWRLDKESLIEAKIKDFSQSEKPVNSLPPEMIEKFGSSLVITASHRGIRRRPSLRSRSRSDS